MPYSASLILLFHYIVRQLGEDVNGDVTKQPVLKYFNPKQSLMWKYYFNNCVTNKFIQSPKLPPNSIAFFSNCNVLCLI